MEGPSFFARRKSETLRFGGEEGGAEAEQRAGDVPERRQGWRSVDSAPCTFWNGGNREGKLLDLEDEALNGKTGKLLSLVVGTGKFAIELDDSDGAATWFVAVDSKWDPPEPGSMLRSVDGRALAEAS